MKQIFIIVSLLFITKGSLTQVVDSLYKDTKWYYCIQPKTDPVRNFYPKDKLHSDDNLNKSEVFEISDTTCENKRIIYVDFLGEECNYKDNLISIDFGTGWVCIPDEEYKIAKVKPGEKLAYDGCRIYRENKVIGHVKHRGFRLRFSMHESSIGRNGFFYKDILTTFIF